MQGGDCLVPRAIGCDTVNGCLAIQKEEYTNRQSLLDLEFQRAPVRCVDGAGLDNCTPGFPAHRLRLAKRTGCSAWDRRTLIGHLPASAVP
jgi:hypothetical protein